MAFAQSVRQPCIPSVSGSLAGAVSFRNGTPRPLHVTPRQSAPLHGIGRSFQLKAKAEEEEDDIEFERLIAWPRMAEGLNVHRRLHATAARNPGYLFQWRAFCERNKLDWQTVHTDEDEGLLAGAVHCTCADTC